MPNCSGANGYMYDLEEYVNDSFQLPFIRHSVKIGIQYYKIETPEFATSKNERRLHENLCHKELLG